MPQEESLSGRCSEHFSKMEEVVEAPPSKWRKNMSFSCLCLYPFMGLNTKLWFPFPLMSLILSPVKKFKSYFLFSSAGAFECLLDRSSEGRGLKDTSTKSLWITCFCHYASHPALCWNCSHFAFLLQTFFLSSVFTHFRLILSCYSLRT